MGQKTVRFSDLSGELITRDDALARIVIHEHPELGDSPVEIEGLADEAAAIEKAALRVAVVDLYLPGEDEPRRVAMEAAAFDELATDRPMSELLLTARPARPTRRRQVGRGGRAAGGQLRHPGARRRATGPITEAEGSRARTTWTPSRAAGRAGLRRPSTWPPRGCRALRGDRCSPAQTAQGDEDSPGPTGGQATPVAAPLARGHLALPAPPAPPVPGRRSPAAWALPGAARRCGCGSAGSRMS